jgi:hypothetical protein
MEYATWTVERRLRREVLRTRSRADLFLVDETSRVSHAVDTAAVAQSPDGEE